MSRLLWLLLALFAFRVIAQPLAIVVPRSFLPSFDSWQSGALPYPILLVSQIAIVGVMAIGARQVQAGHAAFSVASGRLFVAFGTIYFCAMALRLALGITILAEHPWVGRPIPATFHLVLATYVLIYGRFQLRNGTRA